MCSTAGKKSVQFATTEEAQTMHCNIARRGPTQDCNSTRHGSNGTCNAAVRQTTTDTTPTPGGALRPLDPGSLSLACEPARRPRWAATPDSSLRQSRAAASSSRSLTFGPISMLVTAAPELASRPAASKQDDQRARRSVRVSEGALDAPSDGRNRGRRGWHTCRAFPSTRARKPLRGGGGALSDRVLTLTHD